MNKNKLRLSNISENQPQLHRESWDNNRKQPSNIHSHIWVTIGLKDETIDKRDLNSYQHPEANKPYSMKKTELTRERNELKKKPID